MQTLQMLHRAAEYAVSKEDRRQFLVGALAERHDGVIVFARNESTAIPCPEAHAESRLLKKLGRTREIFVARLRRDGSFGLAKPCPVCAGKLRARGIERAFFTQEGGGFSCLYL